MSSALTREKGRCASTLAESGRRELGVASSGSRLPLFSGPCSQVRSSESLGKAGREKERQATRIGKEKQTVAISNTLGRVLPSPPRSSRRSFPAPPSLRGQEQRTVVDQEPSPISKSLSASASPHAQTAHRASPRAAAARALSPPRPPDATRPHLELDNHPLTPPSLHRPVPPLPPPRHSRTSFAP